MNSVIDAIGAPPRKVARCAVRSFVRSVLQEGGGLGVHARSIVVFSRLSHALRAHRRPALYARAAAQPLHRLHLRSVDDRHRGRRRGADRGAVGDERLPEGSAHPHPRRGLAPQSVADDNRARRLAERGEERGAEPAAWSAPRRSCRRRRCSPTARACAAPSVRGIAAGRGRQGRGSRAPHARPARSTPCGPASSASCSAPTSRARSACAPATRSR